MHKKTVVVIQVTVLDVENDPGPVPTLYTIDGGLVPGHGFNGAAQIMTPRIVWFAGGATTNARRFEGVDFEMVKEEVFRVEQENERAQPVDEERNLIVAFDADLACGAHINLLRRDHQAFHALGCVNEQFREGLSIGMQANVGCMLEHFIRFA